MANRLGANEGIKTVLRWGWFSGCWALGWVILLHLIG